jgi:hypothetical protein
MVWLPRFVSTLMLALFTLDQNSAYAVATSTVSITCSATKKLQARIDAVPAGTYGTINVTGTCNENIVVPSGKTIFLIGQNANQGATLISASSQGFLQIRNMTVRSSTGSSTPVQATNGGTLRLVASVATTSSAPRVIGAFNNATVEVVNSRVTNTATAANQDKSIVVDLSSSLNIEGNGSLPAGPDGTRSVVSGAKDAVYCGGNSSAIVIAQNGGSVFVQDSSRGINLNSCSLNIDNRTGAQANLQIRNNNQAGILGYNSDVMVLQATIAGNGTGLYNMLTRAVILGTHFGGAAANTRDIRSDTNSVVDIDDFGGQTSFLNLSESSFYCRNGGEIYYYQPFVLQTLSSYEGTCLKAASY